MSTCLSVNVPLSCQPPDTASASHLSTRHGYLAPSQHFFLILSLLTIPTSLLKLSTSTYRPTSHTLAHHINSLVP